MQAYAKQVAAGAPRWPGRLDAGRVIGMVEAFAARDGVAEVAFAIAPNWRRRGISSALLEAATRWAKQASVGTLYVIEGGRARFVPVEIAQRNTAFAEVVNGVSEGSLVILHPSDRASDGVRVTAVPTGG